MKPYPAYKDSGVPWIGKVPEGWIGIQIRHIVDISDGARIPLNSTERSSMQGDYPYYGANGVLDYINDYIFDGEYILIGEDGAPFFEKGKDVAFLVSGQFWVNNHAHILKAKKDVHSNYIVYALNCVDYKEYITGSTRDKLTQDSLRSIEIPLPSDQEQRAIAAYLDRKTAQIDTLIANKRRRLALLAEERTAIISHTVTRGLDPNAPLKDSGVDCLGNIPAHWNTIAIKRVVHQQSNALIDGPFGSSVDVSRDYVTEGVPVVRTVNITEYGFNPENLRFMRKEKFDQLRRHAVYPGDVLFSKVGTIGNTCVFPSYFEEGILSTTGSCKITVNPEIILSDYMVYTLNSMRENFLLLASSNVQPFLNMQTIKSVIIPVPPLSEQRAIAAYLDAKTAQIDRAVAHTERQIALLQEYRTALISAAVTGKIDVRLGQSFSISSETAPGSNRVQRSTIHDRETGPIFPAQSETAPGSNRVQRSTIHDRETGPIFPAQSETAPGSNRVQRSTIHDRETGPIFPVREDAQ